jgi:trimeric autotransporter adhesin
MVGFWFGSDGDRKTDTGAFRSGTWYINRSAGGISIHKFGIAGDPPNRESLRPLSSIEVTTMKSNTSTFLRASGRLCARRFDLTKLTLVVLCLAVLSFSQAPEDREPDRQPISSILNPDGSMKRGISGNFDPEGFRFITGPDGAPRFVPDDARKNVMFPTTDCGDGWDDRFWLGGTEGDVYAVASDSAGNLYIGGRFTHVGNVAANNIAKWDGANWSALGSGTNSDINAIAVSGSDIYVGGAFSSAGGIGVNNIAKWNGSTWSALESGMSGTVWAIAVSGTDIYVGGFFASAGGVAANNIARWNGSGWSALGSGITVGEVCDPDYGCWYGAVYAIAVVGSDVYAGGWITSAGGVATQGLARWTGSSWSTVGGGTDSSVLALAVSGTDVYAGGWFTTAGGVPANYIAKWNGSSWSSLGSGVGGDASTRVNALAVAGADVYAGFSTYSYPGIGDWGGVAKWNGSSWSDIGTSGTNHAIRAVAVSGAEVYAGGSFTAVGGVDAKGIGKWNGSTWSVVGPTGAGINGYTDLNYRWSSYVSAIGVSGEDVYVGGTFPAAGGVPGTQSLARWNGSSWSALSSGLSSGFRPHVNAIAVSGTDVYVAGSFTMAGGVPVAGIAKWNGSSWSSLGSGMSPNGSVPHIAAIAVSGTDVYVGGDFRTVDGVPANNVAKWNGSSWSALGSGMSDPSHPNGYSGVYSLAVSGTDIYAGGRFTLAGGAPASNIAKWNGKSWSSLGSGVSGTYPNGQGPYAHALAISGTDLYAGGIFTTAGGVTVNSIAKWNGSTWSALGSELLDYRPGNPPSVYGLAVAGTDVYIGGAIYTVGGLALNGIAKWNGSNWSALGTGVNESAVTALAISGSDIYVGGYFTTAGCHAASKFSRYSIRGTKAAFDFDGDGRSDISVFRPSDSVWYLNRSSQGFFATQFGISTDTIVPSDYDGDGRTDVAVFREGVWWLRKSSDGAVQAIQFGIAGDIPVPADYTGDGQDELGVYRSGQWWALDLSSNQSSIINFGLASDKPVPADFDGDGRIDQAVYRNGEWHLNRSSQGYTVVTFGLASDRPVVGDYDGDGRADLAVYRAGTWYLQQSTAGFSAFQWGIATDIPAPADYDGDGKTDAAVFRSGTWYLKQSTSGIAIRQFGLANDIPVQSFYLPQ